MVQDDNDWNDDDDERGGGEKQSVQLFQYILFINCCFIYLFFTAMTEILDIRKDADTRD